MRIQLSKLKADRFSFLELDSPMLSGSMSRLSLIALALVALVSFNGPTLHAKETAPGDTPAVAHAAGSGETKHVSEADLVLPDLGKAKILKYG